MQFIQQNRVTFAIYWGDWALKDFNIWMSDTKIRMAVLL